MFADNQVRFGRFIRDDRGKSMVLGMPTREAYGKALVTLGNKHTDIIVCDADLAKSTMTTFFAKEFPDRFFDFGVAEQNMISTAAGLASCGKIVFASTFAVFATARCFDQLRVSIAQPGLNVKVVASHGGVTVGEDGASHQAIEDLALTCALPGFTVIVPADEIETAQVIEAAANTYGPFYIRCGRPKAKIVYPADYEFRIGKAVTLRDGNDVTLISTGAMTAEALDAALVLQQEGIEAKVISMPTIKPLDTDAIILAARQTRAIVVAEEHLLHGGLGSSVARVVSERFPVPMRFIGINDTYTKSGKPEELLKKYELTAEHIARKARDLANQKSKRRSRVAVKVG